MPFIDDMRARKFEIKPTSITGKYMVMESLVGCVCIGTNADCREYVAQRRTQQAIKEEMRGFNPLFSRWGESTTQTKVWACKSNPTPRLPSS
jgi:hypothetical protein